MKLNALSIALVVGVAGALGGCASSDQSWMTSPVPDAGAAGDRAIRLLRAKSAVAISNLVNADTPGYRATTIIGTEPGSGRLVTEIDQSQGTAIQSGRSFDLCLLGPGYFKVEAMDEPGGYLYTRCGRFTLNAEGQVVLAIQPSMRLIPEVVIPADAMKVTVDEIGRVSYVTATSSDPVYLAQLQVTTFTSPGRLMRDGVLFRETSQSGSPIDWDCGCGTTLLQSYFESSNVDPLVERLHIELARRELGLWTKEPLEQAVAAR